MAKRMIPREDNPRDAAEREHFGERFGNNYGYGREGEHVAPMHPNDEESEYLDRYGPPGSTAMGELPLDQGEGPHTGVGPRGYRRSDERIKEEICERLTRHGYLDARGISLQVQAGEVTLAGLVQDRRSKRLAEDLALGVSGVRDIQNELRLRSR